MQTRITQGQAAHRPAIAGGHIDDLASGSMPLLAGLSIALQPRAKSVPERVNARAKDVPARLLIGLAGLILVPLACLGQRFEAELALLALGYLLGMVGVLRVMLGAESCRSDRSSDTSGCSNY